MKCPGSDFDKSQLFPLYRDHLYSDSSFRMNVNTIRKLCIAIFMFKR